MNFWPFKKRVETAPAKEQLIAPVGEVAISESTLYGKDWPKYNPDGLIGRKGAGIYRKMMTDEQVKAVVHFKRSAITARSWCFEPDEEWGLPETDAEFRCEMFEHILTGMRGSFADALNGILSAAENGVSVTEIVYDDIEYQGRPFVGLGALKLRPFDTFTFKVDKYGNIENLEQSIGGGVVSVPYDKVIHYVHGPDVDEHYGQSELRAAYRAYFSKDISIRTWNIFQERYAGGSIWMQPPDGTTIQPGSPMESQLQSILTNLKSNTGALIPAGFNVELLYPSASGDAFEKAVQAHDKAIAKALLVPNLLGMSEQGTHGSLAQSSTQLEAFLWTLEAEKQRLEEAINEQLVRPLGELNFGDGMYPRFTFAPVSDAMIRVIIDMWTNAVDKGAVRATDTDEAHIRELLRFPEAGEPMLSPAPSAGGQPAPNPPGAEAPGTHPGAGDVPDESTIVGAKGFVEVGAFGKALKRVDFAVIDRRSEDGIVEHTGVAARAMDAGVNIVMRVVRSKNLGTPKADQNAMESLSLPTDDVQAAVRASLENGWTLGQDHAARELGRARGKRFSADFRSLVNDAAAFFEARSFAMAGNLTGAALATIKNELLNGIKYSKSQGQVEHDIYQQLARDGLISEDEAKRRLGTAIGVADASARVRNVIRTGTFEAINEARYATFTDPSLGNYVEALEYSAVLDSRTTAICRELDGNVYPADSEFWDQYRPPNHYQCRSLLVAVTKDDTWSESEAPNVEPQRGFV